MYLFSFAFCLVVELVLKTTNRIHLPNQIPRVMVRIFFFSLGLFLFLFIRKFLVTSDVQIDNNYSNNNRWIDSTNTFQNNLNTKPNIPTLSTPQVVNDNVPCVSNTLNFNGYGPQNIPLEFRRVLIRANGLEIYEKDVAPSKKFKFISGNNRHLC